MGTLLYHPGFQTEIKEKRGEKRKQQRKIRQQKKNPLSASRRISTDLYISRGSPAG